MYLVTIATMFRKITVSCCFECHFKSNVKCKAKSQGNSHVSAATTKLFS